MNSFLIMDKYSHKSLESVILYATGEIFFFFEKSAILKLRWQGFPAKQTNPSPQEAGESFRKESQIHEQLQKTKSGRDNGWVQTIALHTGMFDNGTFNHWNKYYFGLKFGMSAYYYISEKPVAYRNKNSAKEDEVIYSKEEGKIDSKTEDDGDMGLQKYTWQKKNDGSGDYDTRGESTIKYLMTPSSSNRSTNNVVVQAYVRDVGLGENYYGSTTVLKIDKSKEKVIFDYDGGMGTAGESSKTVEKSSGNTITLPTLTKQGYTFAGWKATSIGSKCCGKVGSEVVNGSKTYAAGKTYTLASTAKTNEPASNYTVTFKAQWTPKTFKLTYASGAESTAYYSGAMSDTTATYDSACTLRTNAFSKTRNVIYHYANGTTSTKTVSYSFKNWK